MSLPIHAAHLLFLYSIIFCPPPAPLLHCFTASVGLNWCWMGHMAAQRSAPEPSDEDSVLAAPLETAGEPLV